MAITGVPAAGITPAPIKQTLSTAYLDFTGGSNDWAQQYLPDLMEKEAEVFGNRTISGFLSQVGAEESMASDQVVWSEQGRLHLSYKLVTASNSSGMLRLTMVDGTTTDADGKNVGGAGLDHGIRPGDMIIASDATHSIKAFVNTVATSGTATIDCERYDGNADGDAGIDAGADISVLVYGSEYVKGSVGRLGANKPQHLSRSNKPIILKDKYEVSGSDASAIGWVEVSGEEGQSGYLWYLKASGDTKARFSDYLEMAMMESVTAATAGSNTVSTVTGATGNIAGTEGLWEALESRGNIASVMTNMADWDELLAELDSNGAIEENMIFMDRTTSLQLDDLLAAQNSYGANGTSYGVFNNEEDMALNLGFTGFRRGSYDFYKSDFKYLNDASTRGLINAKDVANAIHGVLIPAGVSSVYDQALGKNLKRPFLHVRYRASNLESRKYKTWTTGSVGATTSDLDAMEMHFLSERCLVTQGANNFVLFKGATA
tara:strand:- start:11494 stop:12960 length:1467 start_codon:yes stop_codon:yes gene_type:complete